MTMTNTHTTDFGELVPEVLGHLPEIKALYVFGSRAQGEARPDSDLDLAVLVGTELPETKLWETAQHLASRIGMEVDLVNLSKASTVMQMQVVRGGRRLYCADEQVCGEFEDFVYSSYARLNGERAGILQDIAQRGRIYG